MKDLDMQKYMEDLREYSLPLSVVKFIGFVGELLKETYSSIDRMITSTEKNDMTLILAQSYQMKIALSLAQYALGIVPKGEVYSAIDDLTDYISSVTSNKQVAEAMQMMNRKIIVSANKLISDREKIVDFENYMEDFISNGGNPDDLMQEAILSDKKIMKNFTENGVSKEEIETLKRGESKTVQVGTTNDGSKVYQTAVRLPFQIGSPVRSGVITGIVVAYFPEELKDGVNDQTHVLVKVNSALADYVEFDLDNFDGIVTSRDELQRDAKYCRVLVKETKNIYA